MKTHRHVHRRAPKAFACILALIVLAVFASLAVVWVTGAGLSLQASSNYGHATQARLAAEGGLAVLLHAMAPIRLPATTDPSTFPGYLGAALGTGLNGTANLSGQTVAVAAGVVTVPEIVLPEGRFTSRLAWADPNRVSLTVTGTSQDASQRVQILLDLVPRLPTAFNYGLASQGQIAISGSAKIVGINDPSEASVLSATAKARPSCWAAAPPSAATSTPPGTPPPSRSADRRPWPARTNPSVIAQHVHFDVAPPGFPDD